MPKKNNSDKPPGVLPIKKITVLYNKVTQLTFGSKEDILADEDTVKTAKNIAKVLKNLGYKVLLFEVNEKTVHELPLLKTDFFFNLCGGIGNIPGSEAEMADILSRLNVPFSGALGFNLKLTTDKVSTKKKFNELKVPTPLYQVFYSGKDKLNKNLHFPLIVKPIAEDCSFGIHNDSVVWSVTKLKTKVEELIERYKEPALVESYINTRELNVTIVGNGKNAVMLPVSEIVFGKSYDDNKKNKIVDFAAKWQENTASYHDTVGVCPSDLPRGIVKKIEIYALRAYKKICGNPGYARMDIRLSEDNEIFFLEINLNPDISDGMGASRSAKAYGWDYPQFLNKIIEVSLAKNQ